MKKTAFLALPFAATLALTGCGALGFPAASQTATTQAAAPTTEAAAAPSAVVPSPAPTTGAPSPTPADQQPTTEAAPEVAVTPDAEAPATGASEQPTGTSYVPAAGSGQLTDAQLASVMDYVKSSFPSNGAVILDSATIKDALPMATSLAESMDVEPASCGALASTSTPAGFESLTMSALSWPGAQLGAVNTVGINSFPNAAAASDAARENKALVAACPSFTMNMAGIKVKATTKPDNAFTGKAGFVDAWVKGIEVDGAVVNTASVTYLVGNNVVTATVSGTGDGIELMTDAEMMSATTLSGLQENS
ncbi:hypothetical protein [Paeniglutamicibacter cryotolerans]|uniref:Sensor domain-containing protein n=1 Tax=Paeniglutamicibacter cryotolerans TaxID=670079 RepID=A0A839QNE2_9MICC|nr:hypothetical protein [Paeniglutamicibacter cryotolerans]MBB2996145.1 hypothetical protein [Paeniglutamicibacter cryotolerans]